MDAGKDTEHLCDLLFEISNEDRLNLLRVLRDHEENVTGLAKILSITTQEVSRHLSRMSFVGLTEKDPDGPYRLTSFGKLVLKQIRGLDFTSYHKDYFITHSLEGVPREFANRLGELSGCEFIDDVMVTIHNIERIIMEAEEYLWDLNLPYIASAFPYIRKAFERGVKGRFLHGESLNLPNQMLNVRQESLDTNFIANIIRSGIYEERLVEASPIIYMSEKEVALLCFPKRDGRYDFYGFSSVDNATHKWCSDLFLDYWELSKPHNIFT